MADDIRPDDELEIPSTRGPRGRPLSAGRAWSRKYPPLAFFVLAVVIVAIVMPSALNLPQSNPSTVLEYAPIPPEDDSLPPPNEGSLSSLGLGSSGGLSTGGEELFTVTDKNKGGVKKEATVKRCVKQEDGLKQTEDPNAPPCVPFFEGDNGGATWQGVTGDEIRVLIYASAHGRTDGEFSPPGNTYCDLDKPPNTDPGCLDDNHKQYDHYFVRATRSIARYFNERYQTYGRRVHFWIYWSPSTPSSSGRRADAADNWNKIKPFAVLYQPVFGGEADSYWSSVVKRRSMIFGSRFGFVASDFYSRFAPMMWGWDPSIEIKADMMASYICQRVAVAPDGSAAKTQFAGGDLNGKPRQYAFFYTTDAKWQSSLGRFGNLVMQHLDPKSGGCLPPRADGQAIPRLTFPRHQWNIDTHPDSKTHAEANVAKMQAAGVTTLLWVAGFEVETTAEMNRKAYFPEIVALGDGIQADTNENARDQNQLAWSHAWVVSNLLRESDNPEDVPGRQAYRETNPRGESSVGQESDENEANTIYRDHFVLFKAIQVAGPKLSPGRVDAGNHAIPKVRSTTPYVAACFYLPGDYTCVKDANVQWWDPNAPDPEGAENARGCYRMVLGGERFITNGWQDIPDPFRGGANDPCNNRDGDRFANPYGPTG